MNPLHFDTHSFRILGASLLMSLGFSEAFIKAMGRWASDIAQLYMRLQERGRLAATVAMAGARSNLRRGP